MRIRSLQSSASSRLAVLSLGLAIGCTAPLAVAQTYPERAVKIVVPFSPGGGNDYLARDIASMLTNRHGQTVIVENKPGAGGAIGSAQVARGAADGYTLLMAANTATIVDATRTDISFSLTKDLVGVGMVADMPIVLVVNPKVGVRNVSELIAEAKRKPGSLNYASSGPGTVQHMAAALFDSLAGTQMVHIPFKGASQMMPEIVANRIQVLFGPANTVMPHIRAGTLTAIGVAGDKRWGELPDVPTIAEQGLAGYKVDLWYALLAPAKTPPAIIDALNKDLQAYADDPATIERFKGQALTPAKSTPAEMNARMAQDVALWKDVARKIQFSTTGD
jgi:tripartite-type tricarboxylate transporter receptor subunit TctC